MPLGSTDKQPTHYISPEEMVKEGKSSKCAVLEDRVSRQTLDSSGSEDPKMQRLYDKALIVLIHRGHMDS